MFGISRQRLYALSRSKPFILRASILIILISTAFAFLVWLAAGRHHHPARAMADQALESEEGMLTVIRNASEWFKLLSPEIAPSSPWFQPGPEPHSSSPHVNPLIWITPLLTGPTEFPENRAALFLKYANARYSASESERETAFKIIQGTALSGSPPPFAHELYADLLSLRDRLDEAITHYRAELSQRESDFSRQQILRLTMAKENPQQLRELLEQPAYRRAASPGLLLDCYVYLKDWTGILRSVIQLDYLRQQPVHSLLAMFVALIWFIIFAQFSGFRPDQLILYGVAILLGIASASLTLFAWVVQHEVYGFLPDSGELVPGLLHNVAGVGLREELIKLLLFLPLIPFLRRRNNEMEVLITAGFVGLGFALQENLGYYGRTGGSAAIARFLTANFLHISLTGIAGLACYRAVRRPRTQWENFLSLFLIVVVAHGLYDAFLSVTVLREYSIVYVIVLALIAYLFFDTAESLYRTGGHQISPLAIFVLGLALLVGLTLNVACYGQPPYPSYFRFLFQNAELIPIAFIFVNRFRDA